MFPQGQEGEEILIRGVKQRSAKQFVASFLASQLSSALPQQGSPGQYREVGSLGAVVFSQIFWCRRVLGLSESGEAAWRRGQADTWRVTKGDGVADSDSGSGSVAEKKLRRETEQLDFCLSVDGLGLGRVPLAKSDRMLTTESCLTLLVDRPDNELKHGIVVVTSDGTFRDGFCELVLFVGLVLDLDGLV
ncbi:hypothetical protein NL676_011700 [Syzygium grande]|nr:hypothetical protein NL676_011700 [Syzygium grande]